MRNTRTKKMLKLSLDKDGYYRVSLYTNNKKYNKPVHRLVALTFLENPDNLPIVDHIDKDRTNNCVNNLRWVDYKGNSRNAKFNKRVKICDPSGNIINTFDTIVEASEYYGIANDKMTAATVVNSKLEGYIAYL